MDMESFSTDELEVKLDPNQLIAGANKLMTFNYEEVPITDIVNEIILDAIKNKASDIHFDPYEKGLKIRIRIDGKLSDYSLVPAYVQKNMITRIKIISGMNITESRVPQDGAIKNTLENIDVDLRVSCLPTNLGEKVVIRILDYKMSSAGIENLDFSKENLEKVKRLIEIPNGIILVTGATGTGKSTTVYSILQRLNTEDRNIITVEDPIEMNIEGINQVQVVSDIGLTFANTLRSILRQDPDIIMIGEIRDDETARIAVRASITGHKVLSTIHTNNSLNTIERLTDMDVERYLLGSALSGIISQKLVRRICPECRILRGTTDYEKSVFKTVLNKDINQMYDVNPNGCEHCFKGFSDRIALHEILVMNDEIRDAITNSIPKEELRKLVYGEGAVTLLEDGLEKALEGSTCFSEILKAVDLENDLSAYEETNLKNSINDSKNTAHSPTTSSSVAPQPTQVQPQIQDYSTLIPTNNVEPTKPISPTNQVGTTIKEQTIQAPPKKDIEFFNL